MCLQCKEKRTVTKFLRKKITILKCSLLNQNVLSLAERYFDCFSFEYIKA